MTIAQSSEPQATARTAAQLLIVPPWMARQMVVQLRSISPGGGIAALLPNPPQFDVQAAAFAAAFR